MTNATTMTVNEKFAATIAVLKGEVTEFTAEQAVEFLEDRMAKNSRKRSPRKVDPAKEEFYGKVADELTGEPQTAKEIAEIIGESAAKVRGALTVLVKRGVAVDFEPEKKGAAKGYARAQF